MKWARSPADLSDADWIILPGSKHTGGDLAWVRERRVWVLVGSALICIAVADLSQHSKGEVERIWVLFFPWVVPATVVLGRRSARAQNGWLVAHAATALVLQAWLVSKW